MSEYKLYLVEIPLKKLQDLLEGKEVPVSRKHLIDKKSGYGLFLNKTCVNNIKSHFRKSKEDMNLKLSKPVINYNLQRLEAMESIDGSGFWSKIGRFFKKAGKAVWKGVKAVAPVAKALLPIAINLVPGAKEVVETGREIGKQAGVGEQVNEGLKQTLGVGIKGVEGGVSVSKPIRRKKALVAKEF